MTGYLSQLCEAYTQLSDTSTLVQISELKAAVQVPYVAAAPPPVTALSPQHQEDTRGETPPTPTQTVTG
jgi:hypothetical protein